MIVAHKNALIQRCNQRGYSLDEVMPCVVSQDGDMWTIDETHEKYPHPRHDVKMQEVVPQPQPIDIGEGVGTELKKLLKLIGINASPTCSCNTRAKTMNENGIEWCKDNIDTIVGWLKEESEKRNLPFFTFGAKKLVNFAIYRAEKGR